MLPGSSHFYGIGNTGGRNKVSFPVGIVPVSGLKSGFALKGKPGKITLRHFILYQVAPFVVENLSCGDFGFYTIQNGDGTNRGPVIITPQHCGIGCIGPDYGNFLFLAGQRQYIIVVLKQGHGLLSHPVGKFPVFFTIQHRGRDLSPGNQGIVIKIAQVKTTNQHTQQAPVNIFFFDQPALNPFGQGFIRIIFPNAFHIGSGQHGF